MAWLDIFIPRWWFIISDNIQNLKFYTPVMISNLWKDILVHKKEVGTVFVLFSQLIIQMDEHN